MFISDPEGAHLVSIHYSVGHKCLNQQDLSQSANYLWDTQLCRLDSVIHVTMTSITSILVFFRFFLHKYRRVSYTPVKCEKTDTAQAYPEVLLSSSHPGSTEQRSGQKTGTCVIMGCALLRRENQKTLWPAVEAAGKEWKVALFVKLIWRYRLTDD